MQQHEKYAQAEQGTGSISQLVVPCFWVMQTKPEEGSADEY